MANQRIARILCGDRNMEGGASILHYLSAIPPEIPARNIIIIHGDCRGADRLAGRAAADAGFQVIPMPYIDALGKAGGPVRNGAMLTVLKQLERVGYDVAVVAFHPDIERSRGTRDMVERATSADVPVTVIAT